MTNNTPTDPDTLGSEADDYLRRAKSSLATIARQLQKRADTLEGQDGRDPELDKELRQLNGAIQSLLKAEGQVNEQQRKRCDAVGGEGMDLDAARAEVECLMARLRRQADARRIDQPHLSGPV